MKTANQEFFDAVVRHQIYLMRYSETVRKDIEKILNATEQDIADKIRSRLLKHQGMNTAGVRKLQSLQAYIKTVRYKAWDEIDEVWLREIKALAKAEAKITAASLRTSVPVLLDLTLPPPGLLSALTNTAPFEGRTLKQWASNIRKTDLDKILQQIKIGMVQGEGSDAIARRIVGTARLKGQDGVTEITRRNAAAITRTAVNHISNAARQEFYRQNSDIMEGELYVSTLDSRTTPVCRANDGKVFELDKGPMPPLHFNCRSLRVAIIGGEAIGNRPAKPTTEKMMLREYAEENNLGNITSRDSLPHGHKGSFDEFSRQRVRQLTGTVPAKTSYQEWLKGQSTEFQDDVLGKTKAKLFRNGGLTLDKFVNRDGVELNLRDLAQKHADAFRAAGLNPESFL
jgi:SPP1 gp7 family putative phage head morphogenesis protein